MPRPDSLILVDAKALPVVKSLGTANHSRSGDVIPDREKFPGNDAAWVMSFYQDINKVFALAYAMDERVSAFDKLSSRLTQSIRELQVWVNQALPCLPEDGPAVEAQLQGHERRIGDQDSQLKGLSDAVSGLNAIKEQVESFRKGLEGLEQRLTAIELASSRREGSAQGRMVETGEQQVTPRIEVDRTTASSSRVARVPMVVWAGLAMVAILQVLTLIFSMRR